MIIAGALFVVIFFQICLIFITKMYYSEQYFNKIKAKYRGKVEEADLLRGLTQRTSTLKSYLQSQNDMVEILARLYDMMPDEIYLKGITVTEESKIFIKGTSKSMSRVFALVTELENDSFFEGVKTEYTESRKEKGEDVSDFGIMMYVEGRRQAEETTDAEAVEEEG